MQKSDVLIIGGGVIGAACADELAGRGVSVTLIDKGKIGHGCSYGNAGWICPCHAMPLPMPGALVQAGRWLGDPESPFYIKPRASWELVRWLLAFASNTTERHLARAGPVIADLARHSLGLFAQFAATDGASADYRSNGLLVVCSSARTLEGARHEMEIAERFGGRGQVLDAEGVSDLEPAVRGSVVGGIFYEDEASADPLRMVQALARRAESRGACVLPGAEVISLDVDGTRIRSVATTRGTLHADQVVLAAGS
ncbi:MAG: amino acid dehydrogenase, partial [Phycisphaeraceae bacterium]|nr:amino acid dehydrogenase [Phycisphaeraceae bacterium]